MDKKKSKNVLWGIVIALLIAAIVLLFVLKGCTKKYEVQFDSNGGSAVEVQTVEKNGKVKEPEIPTRDGYEFAGWYLDDKLFDFSQEIKEDIKLVAKWTKIEEMSFS